MTTLHEVPTYASNPGPPPYRNREQARTVEQAMRHGMVATLRVLQEQILQFRQDATEYIETERVITPLGAMPAFSERLGAMVAALASLSALMEEQIHDFGWRAPEPEPESKPTAIVAVAEAAPATPRDLCWRCGKVVQVGQRRALGDGRWECLTDCVPAGVPA